MEWTKDLVLEFLDLYEQEVVIWNPSHPLYKNREENFEAWKRIQGSLSVSFAVANLKRKKDSLMASYRALANKVKESGKNGEDVFKPNWYAYAKMAKFLRKNQSRDLSEDTTTHSDNFYEDVIGDSSLDDVISINSEERVNKGQLIKNDEDSANSPLPKKRKVEDSKLHITVGEAYSISTSSSPVRQKEEDESYGECKKIKDECDLYVELLATKLRKMDEKTRDIAMNRIDNLLFQMKMEHYQDHHMQPIHLDFREAAAHLVVDPE